MPIASGSTMRSSCDDRSSIEVTARPGVKLYLGTHMPNWLAGSHVPLFVARKRLKLSTRKTLPVATCPWVLDSGGYSELNPRGPGRWTITAYEYAREVRRAVEEIGMLDWAAPMDWMCEPNVLAHTGLTVYEHQFRTIRSYFTLKDIGGPYVPVLQGWTLDDYLRHVEDYARYGIDLTDEPIVAVGSVCRRGDDDEIVRILDRLHREGLRLHAFGVRTRALERIADALVSADSLSWSYRARRDANDGIVPDHSHPRGAKTCSNCLVYAERWYAREQRRLAHTRIGAAA